MNLFNDHLNLSNNIYDNAKILKSVELNKQQELINRNPTTKYYQTLAQNLQEQVQYLKRQLNEVNAPGPTQFPPEFQPPLLAPEDFQVPREPPPTGPNYNWPRGSNLGQGSGQMSDFFPSLPPPGLSRTVGPNPSDYPGGDRDIRYLNDRQRWALACMAYDRVHGKPRQSLGAAIIEDPMRVLRRIIRRGR